MADDTRIGGVVTTTEVVVTLQAGETLRRLDRRTVHLADDEVLPAEVVAWLDKVVARECRLNQPGMAWLLSWRIPGGHPGQWGQQFCHIGNWRIRPARDAARYVGVTIIMATADLIADGEQAGTLSMIATRR